MLNRADFRRRSNFHAARGSEWLRPLLRTGGNLCAGTPSGSGHWRRGLLLGAAHIGDLLYRSASLAQLKAGIPDCEWHFLAEPGPAEVLRTNPALHGVIDGIIPTRPISSAFLQLARQLREERFDVAICYDTGNYWPALLLSAAAGIPNRVGYVHKGFSGLVTHPISIRKPQPFSAYFRDLVAELTGSESNWSLRPRVYVTDQDRAEAHAQWELFGLGQHERVIACFVTTRQPSGQWPLNNFATTIKLLRERHGMLPILCGSSNDIAALERLRAEYHLDCPIVAGRIGLRALVAFLGRCTAVFSTDSGPRHLANAANVPVFFMRNLWSAKVETGTYLDTEIDLAPNAENVEAGQEFAAFRGTTPELIAARITDGLSNGGSVDANPS